MNAHSRVAFAITALSTLLGIGLLFWVSLRKARPPQEFRVVRMLALFLGCLLVPAPLHLLALRYYPDTPYLLGLAGPTFLLSPYAIILVLFTIKKIKGNARQC